MPPTPHSLTPGLLLTVSPAPLPPPFFVPPSSQLLAERYGITDPELVVFDPWSLHGTPDEFKGRRLMQGFLYVRACKVDNEYAHPLDLCPLVDLNLGKVGAVLGWVFHGGVLGCLGC